MTSKSLMRSLAITAICLITLPGLVNAAKNTVIKGKTGSNIVDATLSLGDPFLKDIRLAQSANLTDHWLKSGLFSTRLWLDETMTEHFPNGWSVEVDYSITTQDANFPTSLQSTSSNQILKVDFDPEYAYQDADIAYFKPIGTGTPLVYAWIVVNNVIYKDHDGNILNTDNLPDGLHLDLQYAADRHYTLDETEYPKLLTEAISNSTASGGTANNELLFNWNYQQGAESYDLEWLFVDAGFEPGGNPTALENRTLEFDFRNATRINLKDNNYKISLAYPRGILLWRIRAVGVYAEIQSDRQKFGDWSYAPALNETTNNALNHTLPLYAGVVVGTTLQNTFLDDLNWEYSISYAEDGKHKEVISFVDGAGRNRQSVTRLNSEKLAVVAETKYDHFGRGSVQIAPVPVQDEGINYYLNDAGGAFNGTWDRNDFSDDVAMNPIPALAIVPPLPANPTTAADKSEASQFYSPQHDLNHPYSDRIPDANGYPFAQTMFKNDGTGRPTFQSGMGEEFAIGNGKHYTKYFYANASQDELTRMFGTEVGEAVYYEKVIVSDPNGQKTIQYYDQVGNVIASAYMGVATNLVNADDKDAPFTLDIDFLSTGNELNHNNEAISRFRLYVPAEGPYDISYGLEEAESCLDCEFLPTSGNKTQCVDCEYDVDLKILDMQGNLVWDHSFIGINSQTVGVIETETLQEGEYMVVKTLKLNETQLNSELADIETWLRTASNASLHDCFNFPTSTAVNPCTTDCQTLCEDSYREIVNGSMLYYDALGNIVADEYALGYTQAVATCLQDCEENDLSTYDFCEQQYQLLLADLSPGGQYFENLPVKYQTDPVTGNYLTDAIGNPLLTTNYTTQLWDDWMTTNVTLPSFNTRTSNTFSTWQEVKDNWNDAYAEAIIDMHPEWCAYQYYCIGYSCSARDETIDFMVESNALDRLMFLGESMAFAYGNTTPSHNYNLMDPFHFPGGTQTSLLPLGNNNLYIPAIWEAAPSNDIDPLAFSNTCPPYVLTELTEFATDFLTFTPLNTSTPVNHSIWYVLEDPDGIHSSSIDPNMPQAIYDFYVTLHGDGTTLGSGIIGSEPWQMTPYQFFRMSYKFHRDYLLYEYLKNTYLCDNLTPYTYWDDADYDTKHDGNDFTLNFPPNSNFDNTNLSGTNTFDTTTANNLTYSQNCEAFANDWLVEYGACTGYGNLSSADLLLLKQALIDVCAGGANANNVFGSNLSANPVSITGPSFNPGPFNVISFDDVRNQFVPGCTVSVVHSVPPPPAPDSDCNCDLVEEYVNTVVSGTNVIENYYPTQSELDAIVVEINLDYPLMGYSDAEVQSWIATCRGQMSGMDDRYPPRLTCMDCKCEDFEEYLDGLSIDIMVTPTTTELNNIATDLQFLSGTLYATSVIETWMQTCSTATNTVANNAEFDDYPDVLNCTLPSQVDLSSLCNDAFQNNVDENLANELNVRIAEALASVVNSLTQDCFVNLKSREKFFTTETRDDFYYTLYYYDQAGNLIKTVAPKDFIPLTQTEIDAAHIDRDASSTTDNHANITLPTNYVYNSYNQLTEQSTQDGGTTYFWYDHLGRVMFSQNEEQANITSEEAYSYTRYDELGRPYESGEIRYTAVPILGPLALSPHSLVDKTVQDNLINASNRYEVTQTKYDEILNVTVDGYFSGGQQNLRNRISSVKFTDEIPNVLTPDYDFATHYSYDIHGNVKELIQENKRLAHLPTDPSGTDPLPNHGLKRITYDYDLVSGNVNMVNYQPGQPDQMYHRYHYDADNRITVTETSRDGNSWDRDAKYFYYPHGPLARTELGQNEVQAQDFAYTLQGWLKGVNSNTLDPTRDQGKDGNTATAGLNTVFGQDAMGYSLEYYDNDYNPVTTGADNFLAGINSGSAYYNESPGLYNGNISKMVTAMLDETETPIDIHGNAYHYDQLNRLKEMQVYTATDIATNNNFDNAVNTNNPYEVDLDYDRNGNILALDRKANNGTAMDEMTYDYLPESNQLKLVTDLDSTPLITTDFENPNLEEFEYDKIGNLKKDLNQCIENIEWTVAGKVKKVTRQVGCLLNGNSPADLEFEYDPLGNRIVKIVKPNNVTGQEKEDYWRYTYYVRDASGNPMAVYEQKFGATKYVIFSDDLDDLGANSNASPTTVTLDGGTLPGPYTSLLPAAFTGFNSNNVSHNDRMEELEKEINDYISTPDWTAQKFWDNGQYSLKIFPHFPVTVNSSDVINKVVVFPDPLDNTSQSHIYLEPVGNDRHLHLNLTELPLYGSSRLGIDQKGEALLETDFSITGYQSSSSSSDYNQFTGVSLIANSTFHTIEWLENETKRNRGAKAYELSNHLGNVLSVVSDRKLSTDDGSGGIDYFSANVLSYTDYYPFGSPMPGRNGNQSDYRYGFNGMELDDEVSGNGNQYTTQYRQYDSRIGRWTSLDPLMAKFPNMSPFAAFNNNPIYFVDPEGLAPTGGDDPPESHSVAKGETVYGISKKYGISQDALRKANGIGEDNVIKIGQNLTIPGQPKETSKYFDYEEGTGNKIPTYYYVKNYVENAPQIEYKSIITGETKTTDFSETFYGISLLHLPFARGYSELSDDLLIYEFRFKTRNHPIMGSPEAKQFGGGQEGWAAMSLTEKVHFFDKHYLGTYLDAYPRIRTIFYARLTNAIDSKKLKIETERRNFWIKGLIKVNGIIVNPLDKDGKIIPKFDRYEYFRYKRPYQKQQGG